MKKTKLKLKKVFYVVPIILIFLAIASFVGFKVYEDMQYKKTNEYKLLNIGYTLEEIDTLNNNLSEEKITELTTQEKNNYLLNIISEKYYLKRNLERYLAYHDLYPSYPTNQVIALVNTNNDYDYYEHDIDTDSSKEELLLVNKYYHLSADYTPDDLVEVANTYYYGDNHQVRASLYQAFINMWNAALKDDIKLIINSSYRSYDEQVAVYNDYEKRIGTEATDEVAARPGYSEHQTGLAIDIFSTKNTTTSNFKNSPAHLWLINNAYKYGFIQRYPENKKNITGFNEEAWHWRYVGIEAATYIHDNDITFDEYYAYFLEK